MVPGVKWIYFFVFSLIISHLKYDYIWFCEDYVAFCNWCFLITYVDFATATIVFCAETLVLPSSAKSQKIRFVGFFGNILASTWRGNWQLSLSTDLSFIWTLLFGYLWHFLYSIWDVWWMGRSWGNRGGESVEVTA